MPNHEILLELLPQGGEWLSRNAAWTALNEKLNEDLPQEEFDKYIWLLGDRVIWAPHEGRIRRQTGASLLKLPSSITCETDIEGWFERFIWKRATKLFYEPAPPSLSLTVQNTARVGTPSGRWTKPDVCMACVARYHYSPLPQFDLFSFELKMPSGCNMLAVHETLSHTATSHYGYLCIYLPEGSREASNLPSMLEQAQRHGVGVIRTPNPMDESSYELLLSAQRQSPHPAKIDGFIEDRFDEANRLALRRWVHR